MKRKSKERKEKREVEKEMRKKVWLLAVTIKKNDQLQGSCYTGFCLIF